MASKFYTNIYKDGRAFSLANIIKNTTDTMLYAGDPALNWCLGGGWVKNRLNLIYGPSRSGKSFLAMIAAGKAQKSKPEGDVIIFDSEYYYEDPNVALRVQTAGLNPESTHIVSSNRLGILFGRLGSLEADLIKGDIKISAIIVDSLGGVQSELAEDKIEKAKSDEAGNAGRGNAKYINPILGVLLRLSAEHGITTFLVQHCISNQEEYGPPNKLIGGQRLQLLSHAILYVEGCSTRKTSLFEGDTRIEADMKEEEAKGLISVGKKILARCEKSRNTVENKKAEFFINFAEMRFARPEESLFNLATNLKVLSHPVKEDGKEQVAYWEFRVGDAPVAKFHGEAKAVEALKDKDFFMKVFEACRASSKMSGSQENINDVIHTNDWNA